MLEVNASITTTNAFVETSRYRRKEISLLCYSDTVFSLPPPPPLFFFLMQNAAMIALDALYSGMTPQADYTKTVVGIGR